MKTLTNTEGFAVEEGKGRTICSFRKIAVLNPSHSTLIAGWISLLIFGGGESHESLCDEVVFDSRAQH